MVPKNIIEAYYNTNLLGIITVRARPDRLSALSRFHSKSVLFGAFVWARRALTAKNGDFRPGQCDPPTPELLAYYDAVLAGNSGCVSDEPGPLGPHEGGDGEASPVRHARLERAHGAMLAERERKRRYMVVWPENSPFFPDQMR